MTTSGSETSPFFRERIYLVIVAPGLDQFSLVHEVAHVFLSLLRTRKLYRKGQESLSE